MAGIFTLHAQPAYYYGGSEQLALLHDPWRVCLHFHDEVSVSQVLDTSGLGLRAVYPPGGATSEVVLLEFRNPQTGTPQARLQGHLLDTLQLRSLTWGFMLPDSLPLQLTHRLIYRPSAAPDTALWNLLLAQHDAQPLPPTPTGIRLLDVSDLQQVLPLADLLYETSLVQWVQPDFLAAPARASDPIYPIQFYLHNTGQLVDGIAGTPDIDIDAPEAWAFTLGSPSLVISVMDEGVAPHEDIEDAFGNSRILPGYSIIDTLAGTGAPMQADEMHGQACAGLIAASHNTLGMRGVIPMAQILPVYMPFSPLNPISAMADGLNWCWQQGADVMSNSWTYYTCVANPFPAITQALDDATQYGRGGLGCVVTFAAGNITSCVGFPSTHPSVLAMGAVDLTGQVAPYSNFGPTLDLVVPSAGYTSNVRTLDRMNVAGINPGSPGDLPDINYTRYFGGTSTATAVAAGAAGLLLSGFSFLTQTEVRNLLQQSAVDLGAPGQDDLTGHGLLNIYFAIQAALAAYPLDADLPADAVADLASDGTLRAHAAAGGLHLFGPSLHRAELVDICGRSVARWHEPGTWLPVGALAPGCYTLRTVATDGTQQSLLLRWP
ncbi:MAG: hypothetical protein OHK0039_30270 [Bacteroidia bacterium]